MAIQSGHVVWINGPFPCGDWPDVRIARDALHGLLKPWEMYVSDGGYKLCGGYAVTPYRGIHPSHIDYMRGNVRA